MYYMDQLIYTYANINKYIYTYIYIHIILHYSLYKRGRTVAAPSRIFAPPKPPPTRSCRNSESAAPMLQPLTSAESKVFKIEKDQIGI